MLKGNPEIGVYNRELPKGCELCRVGGKLVVFVTGECGDSCYYCPVSENRFGKDILYANEKQTNDVLDLIYEAYRMGANGAGITGGDPIVRLDRVIEIITKLKAEFGDDFHIHLYTSGRYINQDSLEELQRSGLDEIRFHPINKEYLVYVEKALKYSMDVGIEVPAIPGEERYLDFIVKWAENHGIKFVNINELEITERNASRLNSMGLRVSHGLAGSNKSSDMALSLLKNNKDCRINLHYCSSVYKDVVETRTRFLRTIKYSSKPYEEFTGEGTIIKAIVKSTMDLSQFGELENEKYTISYSVAKELLKQGKVDEVKVIEELPYGLRISESVESKSK
ncbi:radical SAM protein [Acidianus sp. RZ1]|uniref:radical SAM protein n=1 Tax=Acidianus sp. RZ1 TaxID=1540082 RepID=UPI00149120D1|nr:radical SAM protein [Acidianus sp. RZ1]NON62216.1 radical SAM protein [Acidianus sp. RZ1]